jgi:hypothetical protein
MNCLHLQGQKVSPASNQQIVHDKSSRLKIRPSKIRAFLAAWNALGGDVPLKVGLYQLQNLMHQEIVIFMAFIFL